MSFKKENNSVNKNILKVFLGELLVKKVFIGLVLVILTLIIYWFFNNSEDKINTEYINSLTNKGVLVKVPLRKDFLEDSFNNNEYCLENREIYWCRGKIENSMGWRDFEIQEADKNSFRIFKDVQYWAVDKNNIFFWGHNLSEIGFKDIKKFQIIKGLPYLIGYDGILYKDDFGDIKKIEKQTYYYHDKKMDIGTFKVLGKIEPIDLPDEYLIAKDKNTVFLVRNDFHMVENVQDYLERKQVTNGYVIDHCGEVSYIYPIRKLDARTFKVLDKKHVKDKNGIYHLTYEILHDNMGIFVKEEKKNIKK